MATKKLIICDCCGKEEAIEQEYSRPIDWYELDVRRDLQEDDYMVQYIVCDDCGKKPLQEILTKCEQNEDAIDVELE